MASGTEISYLIRIVLQRIGLTPNSKQLRIVGSSASLDLDNEKALDFIDGFFGVDNVKTNFNIIQAVPKYSDLDLHNYFDNYFHLYHQSNHNDGITKQHFHHH